MEVDLNVQTRKGWTLVELYYKRGSRYYLRDPHTKKFCMSFSWPNLLMDSKVKKIKYKAPFLVKIY